MEPQLSGTPLKGQKSVMKLMIPRLPLPLPVIEMYKKRQNTDTATVIKLSNAFEYTNEKISAKRNITENPSNTENEKNAANETTTLKNIDRAEQVFMKEFGALLKKFNMISTDTCSMIDTLNDAFIKSEETLENILRCVENYSKSNINNATASTAAAEQKITNANQNRKHNINYDDKDNDKNYDHVKNKAPKINRRQKRNKTFILPPEYDPNDTKWTLKHRKYKLGLVELMPQSGVFVNAVKFANCKRSSSDCKTLARMLLLIIFSRNALSVCSLTGARAKAFNTEDRPGLDEHARIVLLTFVEEYGREKRWSIPEGQAVVNSIRSKIQDMRAKFGTKIK